MANAPFGANGVTISPNLLGSRPPLKNPFTGPQRSTPAPWKWMLELMASGATVTFGQTNSHAYENSGPTCAALRDGAIRAATFHSSKTSFSSLSDGLYAPSTLRISTIASAALSSATTIVVPSTSPSPPGSARTTKSVSS